MLCPRSIPSTKRLIRSPVNPAGIVTRESLREARFHTARVASRRTHMSRTSPVHPSCADMKRKRQDDSFVPSTDQCTATNRFEFWLQIICSKMIVTSFRKPPCASECRARFHRWCISTLIQCEERGVQHRGECHPGRIRCEQPRRHAVLPPRRDDEGEDGGEHQQDHDERKANLVGAKENRCP